MYAICYYVFMGKSHIARSQSGDEYRSKKVPVEDIIIVMVSTDKHLQKGNVMKNREITKKLEDGKTTFQVDAWPENTLEAIEMWGEGFVFNAIDQQAMIAARSTFVSKAEGTDSTEGLGLKGAADEMADWKPNAEPKRRGLSKVEKLVRDAKKAGFEGADIEALVAAIS